MLVHCDRSSRKTGAETEINDQEDPAMNALEKPQIQTKKEQQLQQNVI